MSKLVRRVADTSPNLLLSETGREEQERTRETRGWALRNNRKRPHREPFRHGLPGFPARKGRQATTVQTKIMPLLAACCRSSLIHGANANTRRTYSNKNQRSKLLGELDMSTSQTLNCSPADDRHYLHFAQFVLAVMRRNGNNKASRPAPASLATDSSSRAPEAKRHRGWSRGEGLNNRLELELC